MKLIKPKFWSEKNILSYLLYPFSIITHLANLLKKNSPKKKFNIKTICVGNIYTGGTGKTSLAIKINEILKKKFKTVFIKKNYADHQDEIKLLKKKGDVISFKNRILSLSEAQKKFNIAILDDGLQQKTIKYNLKIVCINSTDGFGNGFLLPAGPLRESVNEIKNYDLAFLNGEKKNNQLKKKIKRINKNIKIFESIYEPIQIKKFDRSKNYLLLCCIGNPHEFQNTLEKYKFKIKRKIIYPDHYKITYNEIKKIKTLAKKEDLNIITTEKDFFRLDDNQKKNINYLKIKLKIKNEYQFKKLILKI
jgi:tetraacyldisaccharide 4'-kinase